MASSEENARKIRLCVDAGVCRFHTTVRAFSDDEGNILYEIESECPHASKIQDNIPREMTPFDVMKMPFSENPIYECCGKVLPHSACPVPSALIKAAEVAAGFGLKRRVCMTFED